MTNAILLGTLGGLVSALATTVGALPSLFKPRKGFSLITHMSMEFALGMMLAAAAFSLIVPAGSEGLHRGTFGIVVISIVMGAFFIGSLGTLGERFRPQSAGEAKSVSSNAWLFIVAMMLHNLPEGLASGAALAGLDWHKGLPVLGAIALQNLPEGLTTAVSFRALGASKRAAFGGALVSAFVELFGGTMGGALLTMAHNVLPYLLAFAGGAMLFVATREVRERFEAVGAQSRLKVVREIGLGMASMYVMGLLL